MAARVTKSQRVTAQCPDNRARADSGALDLTPCSASARSPSSSAPCTLQGLARQPRPAQGPTVPSNPPKHKPTSALLGLDLPPQPVPPLDPPSLEGQILPLPPHWGFFPRRLLHGPPGLLSTSLLGRGAQSRPQTLESQTRAGFLPQPLLLHTSCLHRTRPLSPRTQLQLGQPSARCSQVGNGSLRPH